MLEKTVEVQPGQSVKVSGSLKRTVDTRGWISTDYHAHSTPSGDNYCNTDDRIINLVAEHIEFAPATEHNRIYDWQPHIERLGLTQHIKTIVGWSIPAADNTSTHSRSAAFLTCRMEGPRPGSTIHG